MLRLTAAVVVLAIVVMAFAPSNPQADIEQLYFADTVIADHTLSNIGAAIDIDDRSADTLNTLLWQDSEIQRAPNGVSLMKLSATPAVLAHIQLGQAFEIPLGREYAPISAVIDNIQPLGDGLIHYRGTIEGEGIASHLSITRADTQLHISIASAQGNFVAKLDTTSGRGKLFETYTLTGGPAFAAVRNRDTDSRASTQENPADQAF